jgi:hypothetical protein
VNNIGLHIIGDAFEPRRLLGPNGEKPRVVKLVDPSLAFKRAVRDAVGADCLIIIRFYEREQPLDAPRAKAMLWYQRHVAQMLAMCDPNVAFESYNEIPDSQATEYCEFECARLEIMHRAGFRSIVGNFSVGTPDLPTWNVYQPMLDALGPGDYVGLHEYWGSGADILNPWFCGRWTLVPQLRGKKIVVTECGRDAVNGGPGGWKRGVDDSTYISEIARYAQVLDGRLACVFTGGDARHGWGAFDVNDIWERVTKMYTQTVTKTPTARKYRLYPWLRYWNRWTVSRPFGYKSNEYSGGVHKGADMVRADGGTMGATVRCPFERAIVDVVSWREDRGWYVYVHDPEQDIEFFICHLAHEPPLLPGQSVGLGDVLGHVGNTGRLTTGPHLHVGVCEVDGNLEIIRWLDPLGPEVEIVIWEV